MGENMFDKKGLEVTNEMIFGVIIFLIVLLVILYFLYKGRVSGSSTISLLKSSLW